MLAVRFHALALLLTSLGTLVSALSGCVLASSHERTELIRICTEDVPLPFSRQRSDLAVATLPLGDVGDQVDDNPGASATLESAVFARSDASDFSFVDSVRVELIAGGGQLPDVAIASNEEPTGEAPMLVPGDSSINLVDYLVSDSAQVRFEITGDIEQATFLTLFSACLDVEGVSVEDLDE